MDLDEEDLQLLRDIARGDALTNPPPSKSLVKKKNLPPKFIPLYKHPLPLSNNRHKHETNLRKILSCALEKQALGAISIGDAWVLEEVYIRGAPVELKDGNGFTPLHIACQLNNFNAVMVLLNIEVDINALSVSGATPLYLAYAANARQCITLLEEASAKRHVPTQEVPTSALLFTNDGRIKASVDQPSVLKMSEKNLGLPHKHSMF